MDRTQLFDLSRDPYVLVNLAYQPERGAEVAQLTPLLEKEMAPTTTIRRR
jgi:hypothetical protein